MCHFSFTFCVPIRLQYSAVPRNWCVVEQLRGQEMMQFVHGKTTKMWRMPTSGRITQWPPLVELRNAHLWSNYAMSTSGRIMQCPPLVKLRNAHLWSNYAMSPPGRITQWPPLVELRNAHLWSNYALPTSGRITQCRLYS